MGKARHRTAGPNDVRRLGKYQKHGFDSSLPPAKCSRGSGIRVREREVGETTLGRVHMLALIEHESSVNHYWLIDNRDILSSASVWSQPRQTLLTKSAARSAIAYTGACVCPTGIYGWSLSC